jgi:hypothetical protein
LSNETCTQVMNKHTWIMKKKKKKAPNYFQ